VVQYKDARSFVLTDLPGLIEGAAEGAGLGHRFLKHMQRCRVVVHLVDASSTPVAGRDLVRDFDAINRELSLFDPALGRKPQLVAANKVDVPEAREAAELFARALAERGIRVHAISGATGEGLPALLDALVRELDSASTAPLLERDLVAADVPEPAVSPEAAPLSATAAVRVEALTEDDLAENARARRLPDEREESAREKARRAPKPTGRRKDGVLKAKAVELETKGAMPHKSRAAKTRAAVQALEAAAPRTAGPRAEGKDLARAAATRRARKGTSASAKRKKT
jgi:GTP-binding protein